MKKLIAIIFILLSVYPVYSAENSAEKNLEVYFTSPEGKINGTVNPADGLSAAIRNSEKSFHGAFYDISSIRIADELIAASKRGVEIKLVTENDNFSGEAVEKILESGISVVPDTGQGLMHNKFAVIDDCLVFTGSYNTTDNCTYKNNNNALVIRSPELAAVYDAEFHEMFDLGIFGNRKEEGAFSRLFRKNSVKLGGTGIEVCFAPEDNIETVIKNRIEKSCKSIKFMQFSFTSDIIGEMMIQRFKDGIPVEGVFEKRGSGSEYSEYIKMKVEGLAVKTDTNVFVMHHKVIIIDDRTVITGSFNLSKNANSKNDENILIIEDPEIALKYIEEFQRIYGKADQGE